jgi:hypothetical protein
VCVCGVGVGGGWGESGTLAGLPNSEELLLASAERASELVFPLPAIDRAVIDSIEWAAIDRTERYTRWRIGRK